MNSLGVGVGIISVKIACIFYLSTAFNVLSGNLHLKKKAEWMRLAWNHHDPSCPSWKLFCILVRIGLVVPVTMQCVWDTAAMVAYT